MKRNIPTQRDLTPQASAAARAKAPPLARPADAGARPYVMDGIKARARDIGARTELPRSARYVITCAQNNTPVHEGFLAALYTYCARNHAELVVIPLLYKNPTSPQEDKDDDRWWDAKLLKHFFAGRQSINGNIAIYGDVKLQPTKSAPTSGMDAFGGAMSIVVGHPKLQLRSVASPSGRLPKLITTTGAVTLENYSASAVGKIGEFHHTFGAIVVEIDGDKFHLRQINAEKDTGEFTDLDKHYTATGVKPAEPAYALVMGDTHVDFIDPAVESATFGPAGMIETLKPRNLFWHDLVDGYSVNPHHDKNPFNAIAKLGAHRHVAKDEIVRALKFVADRTKGATSWIVSSNHDDFFRRWIIKSDWKEDPANAVFYLETALRMAKDTKMTERGTAYPSPLLVWARRLLRSRKDVKFLGAEDSHAFDGIEFCLHGDRGPNGARGSAKNLRRIGVKSVIGHSHSPCIDEGCYQVGTSTSLRLEYNSGPSSWLNTHCVVYANGKRSLINVINGEWRLS